MQTAEIHQFPVRERQAPKGPQVEDGYTRIANELYEVVNNGHACPVNVRHLRIIHALIRRTYGFNKTMDEIADTQLAADTGIPRSKVNVAKHELIAMKVIKLSDDGRKIGINKDYASWDFSKRPEKKAPKAKSKMDQNGNSVTKMVTHDVTKKVTHKRQKDSLEPNGSKSTSKKSSPKKWGEAIDHELAEFMFTTLTAHLNNPKRKSMTAWANEIRLMRTIDHRTPDQIRYLCNWIARDSFWRGNVMCPAKLREKWDQLESKVIAFKESRHANRPGYDAKRAEQDRIAARLADPHDSGWIDGLFPEEDAASGASEPSVYPAGSDLSKDVAHSVQHGPDADAGQAGGGDLDGEVVNAADHPGRGYGRGADQSRGRGMAAERGQSGEVFEAQAGGFWNA